MRPTIVSNVPIQTNQARKEVDMNDYVKEAPYHPGYEDAVVDGVVTNWITEYLAYKERHLNTAKNIIQFIKESNKTKR